MYVRRHADVYVMCVLWQSWRVVIFHWIIKHLEANQQGPLSQQARRGAWCAAAVLWHLAACEERLRFQALLRRRFIGNPTRVLFVTCGELVQDLGPPGVRCVPVSYDCTCVCVYACVYLVIRVCMYVSSNARMHARIHTPSLPPSLPPSQPAKPAPSTPFVDD